jgi:hypothetical protein
MISHLILLPLLVLFGNAHTGRRDMPSGQSSPAPFSLIITAAKDKVEAGSDIKVSVVMTNTSQRDITLDFSELSRGFFDCSFEVLDETMFPVRVTESGLHHCLGPTSTTCCTDGVLQPGQSMRGEPDLSKVYDLRRPGKYSMRLLRLDTATNALVQSNTVIVVVAGPPPPGPPFSLAISTPKRTFSVGSEIRLAIVLTNTSTEPLAAWDGRLASMTQRTGYIVNVRHSGRPVPFKKNDAGHVHFAEGSGMGYQSELTLDGAAFHAALGPKEMLRNEIVLTDQLDFSAPGDYTIQVQRALENNSQVAAKSNILAITVTEE